MLLRSTFACLVAATALTALGACSDSGNNPTSSQGTGTGTGTGTSAGGNGQGAGATGGSTGAFTTGTGGNGQCANTCSSDLHQVLDCNGAVVVNCPPDQGCGASGCVPACQAALENKSTIGCDYYSVAPDIISAGAGACFAAYVANTWGSPVTISVERDGQTFDVSTFARIPSGNGQAITYAPLPNGQLPAGEVAILFLARFGNTLTNCPPGIPPAYTATDAAVHGTGLGEAFHIVTSAPTVAYDIFPYGGGASAATSATLLLPTTAWGTNYVAVDAFRKSTFVASAQPSIDIVASEDDTSVTISPTATIIGGGGVTGTGQGVPATYTLQKGQVLQFTQDAELIGSPIQSDKPIGLWGAASCLSIDVDQQACDSAHQQIPPVAALGHEYVAVRYRNRFPAQAEETPPWRFVGAVAGTNLTYEPSAPAGAPSSLASGEVAEFTSAGPFIVRSQDADHPFYVSGHMTGCAEVSSNIFSDCRGDPEFVNVIPSAQYLSKYTFFTDPTYPETNLVLVRERASDGFFKDVDLDCAGVIGGWQAVGGSPDFEYTRIDLVTGNFAPVGACDNGRHEISSAAPFGLTVWGWGSGATAPFVSQAVSYAYPAGASVQTINTVIVPPIPQ